MPVTEYRAREKKNLRGEREEKEETPNKRRKKNNKKKINPKQFSSFFLFFPGNQMMALGNFQKAMAA